MLIDATKKGLTGKEAEVALDKAGITANKNTIPFDLRKPYDPSGIRLGTPALTTRGFKEKEMELVGQLIAKTLKNIQDSKIQEETKKAIKELLINYPLYPDLKY